MFSSKLSSHLFTTVSVAITIFWVAITVPTSAHTRAEHSGSIRPVAGEIPFGKDTPQPFQQSGCTPKPTPDPE